MRVRLEKYSDGIAVLVPRELAAEAGLSEGAAAELALEAGRLVIRMDRPATLDEMLARITPDNLHAEWADGKPSGAELL